MLNGDNMVDLIGQDVKPLRHVAVLAGVGRTLPNQFL